MTTPPPTVDAATVLAAVAISMQAIVLEIEASGGPGRHDFSNRIKSCVSDVGEASALEYCLSLIAGAVEMETPKPPSLRLV